jgi:hypothetical protein
MFTPEKLLEIAVDAMAVYKTKPSGVTRSSDEMDSYRVAQQAETCALWLERFGNGQPVESIGPFGNKDIKTGDHVRVKKGARLYTTHPAYKRVHEADGGSYDKIAGTAYVVKVSHENNGWAPYPNHYHDHELKHKLRNQTVHWAGTGGYWFWTDATNVEKV